MIFSAGLAMIGLSTMGAHAQAPGDFEIWPDILLAANSDGNGYMVNGVGAPSVAYDPDQQRYVMAFEVRLPQTDPLCPFGMWGIGLATSDDGISNWVTLPTPILEPAPGTYYACTAAHPSILYWPPTRTLYIWSKAEQTDPPDDAIGPSRFVGVGRIRVRVKEQGGFEEILIDEDPVLTIDQNFGIPRVVHNLGTFYMSLTRRPDMFLASAPNTSDFVLGAARSLQPGEANPPWAVDELFNASLVCETDLAFPFSVFIGGYDLGHGAVIEAGGWGKAVSSDGVDWLLGVDPYFEFSGADDWRHWDVVRVGLSDYLVWFDEKDGNQRNQVRFASTVETWNDGDVYSKVCLSPGAQ